MYSMMHARFPLHSTQRYSNGDRRPVASVLLSLYRLLLTELELPVGATVLYDQAHGYSSVLLGFDQGCVCVCGGWGLGDQRECEVLVGCRGGGWTPRAAALRE